MKLFMFITKLSKLIRWLIIHVNGRNHDLMKTFVTLITEAVLYLTISLLFLFIFVVWKRFQVFLWLFEDDRTFPQAILQIFTQAVLHQSPSFVSFDQLCLLHGFKISCSVCLGEAAGEPVFTLSKRVVEITMFPDVGRLIGQVLCDIMVKDAFLPKLTFTVFLGMVKKVKRIISIYRNLKGLHAASYKKQEIQSTWMTDKHSRFSS